MFDRQSKVALIVAAALLVGCGLGFRAAVRMLNIYLQKEPVPLRESLTNISRSLGDWQAQGQDTALDQATLDELGTDKYLDRAYAYKGSAEPIVMAVHISYYTGFIDAVPHVPDRCFVAGGWTLVGGGPSNLPFPLDTSDWAQDTEHNDRYGQPYMLDTFTHRVTGQPITVRMPAVDGEFELRTVEMQHTKRSSERVFAGYCFVANGCFTPSPEGVKLFAFDQRDKYAYYCKLQFVAMAVNNMSRERFLELAADLTDELLPEMMRCLPDWVDVNAAEHTATPNTNL